MHEEWLSVIMQHAFSEIYVFDRNTLRFLEVSRAGRDNLQYDSTQLAAMTPLDLLHESAGEAMKLALQNLENGAVSQTLQVNHVRRDGSSYPLQLRLARDERQDSRVYIAVGNDQSSLRASAAALGESESRFQTIVSHTPGLVFQMLQQDDTLSFRYLSDGCQALLGLSGEQLIAAPALFLDLILAEDRPSFLEAMTSSAAGMHSWNWAGRIWIDAWKDIKWINLRATPHRGPGTWVQWDGIMSNITQSKHEELEIKQSRARLAELSAHIERIKEQERTRIAREIHDDLGGNLTAIKMALALLTRRLPGGDAALADKANYVEQLVDRTIEAAHRISLDLRPSMLDLGIVAALEWQTSELEKQLGIPCRFASNRKEVALHLDRATALFRIFQEALTNIAKHAGATRVEVRLSCSHNHLKLQVSDNGCGINPADRRKPASFGIRGMQERARALGGTVRIARAVGSGSVVSIKIALNNAQASDNEAAAWPQQ